MVTPLLVDARTSGDCKQGATPARLPIRAFRRGLAALRDRGANRLDRRARRRYRSAPRRAQRSQPYQRVPRTLQVRALDAAPTSHAGFRGSLPSGPAPRRLALDARGSIAGCASECAHDDALDSGAVARGRPRGRRHPAPSTELARAHGCVDTIPWSADCAVRGETRDTAEHGLQSRPRSPLDRPAALLGRVHDSLRNSAAIVPACRRGTRRADHRGRSRIAGTPPRASSPSIVCIASLGRFLPGLRRNPGGWS